jgi:hypothetical protein
MVEKYSDGRYVFLNKTPDQNLLVGYRDSINGITVHYPDPVLIAERPMSYDDVTVDAFTAELQVGVDMNGSGTTTLHADGYGTLMLPNGTYSDVLRVHLSQTEVDTIVGLGATSTTYIDTYLWYDNAHASVLLKIDTVYSTSGFSSKTVVFLEQEITSVPNLLKQERFKAAFHTNALLVFGSFDNGSILELFDAAGRLVSTNALNEGSVLHLFTFEQTLPVGLYCVAVKRNGASMGTAKTLKFD